jgi:predicted neuraminidase
VRRRIVRTAAAGIAFSVLFLLYLFDPVIAQEEIRSVLTGTWECLLQGGPRGDEPFTLELSHRGDKVIGRVVSPQGGADITSASFTDGAVELQAPSAGGTYVLAAKLRDGILSDGRATLDGKAYGAWEGRKATASEDGIEKLADGSIRPSSIAGLDEGYLPIVFPSSHASNLLALQNGDLLCAYYSGTWEGESGVAIVVSRLAKGSSRWMPPTVAAQKQEYAFENPVLFEPAKGLLWLFHTSQAANAGQSKSQIFWQTSSDGAQNWTESRPLFRQAGAFDRQRLLVLGRAWVFPMYYTPSNGITGTDALRNNSAIQISSDRGSTWKACSVPGSDGLVQPDVIQLSSEHLLAFFRSRFADWVYKSTSEDGCRWTTPLPTQIPNNNSSTQAARLEDGHLVFAFNNSQASTKRGKATTAARWPLSVALSVDGGRTWPWVRDVEGPNESPRGFVPDAVAGIDVSRLRQAFIEHLYSYEYPSIVQTPDGVIHMSYTFRRRTIKYVAFDEEWIKGGATRGVFKGDQIRSR